MVNIDAQGTDQDSRCGCCDGPFTGERHVAYGFVVCPQCYGYMLEIETPTLTPEPIVGDSDWASALRPEAARYLYEQSQLPPALRDSSWSLTDDQVMALYKRLCPQRRQ